jgi:hypothetical protein
MVKAAAVDPLHDTHEDLFSAYAVCPTIEDFTAAAASFPAAINDEDTEDAAEILDYVRVVCAKNPQLAGTRICTEAEAG